MRKIGLLGGTFDPPHIGHFIIAQEVRNTLALDEIWFIPTNEPPHKEKAMISPAHRLHMLKAATKDSDTFYVNDVELAREGKSYTIDTIKYLQELHPNDTFYFIIGADMVEYLPKWNKVDELMEKVHFVGVMRPNYQLKTKYPITIVDIPSIDISSTYIRNQWKKGLDIKYFLPHEVYIYMKEHF